MVEAPERIWANGSVYAAANQVRNRDGLIEYLRADIAERQIAELRADLEKGRKNVVAVMKALMATGSRDNLLLADAVHKADDAARAALSGSGAGGWRMTPRMAEAGKAKLLELGYTDVEFTDAQKIFEAMIAAAPTGEAK